MPSDQASAFSDKLDSFVFFHLGADAEVEVRETGQGGLEASIRHDRVHDFQFALSPEDLARLAGDEAAFEDFMLDQLTAHRRGGLDEPGVEETGEDVVQRRQGREGD